MLLLLLEDGGAGGLDYAGDRETSVAEDWESSCRPGAAPHHHQALLLLTEHLNSPQFRSDNLKFVSSSQFNHLKVTCVLANARSEMRKFILRDVNSHTTRPQLNCWRNS